MIGERNQRVEMHFNGDISLPAQAKLTLQIDGDGFDSTLMQVIQNGTKITIIQNGEVVPIENPAGAASLPTDYLAYLAAVENVRQNTFADGTTHFTFDINGAKLADYVRREMQTAFDTNPASADGALLGNGTTDYVIGGSARDESSWIDRVEIDLPAGAGTVTTDKNNPWAYTWHLPADGDYNITARAFDFVGHTATDITIAKAVSRIF